MNAKTFNLVLLKNHLMEFLKVNLPNLFSNNYKGKILNRISKTHNKLNRYKFLIQMIFRIWKALQKTNK